MIDLIENVAAIWAPWGTLGLQISFRPNTAPGMEGALDRVFIVTLLLDPEKAKAKAPGASLPGQVHGEDRTLTGAIAAAILAARDGYVSGPAGDVASWSRALDAIEAAALAPGGAP